MPMLRLSGETFTRPEVSKTVRSPKEIRPSSAVSRPARQRSVVVLPQPLGPSRTRNSPSSISRSSPSMAVAGGLPAKRLVSPSIRTLDIVRPLLELCVPLGLVSRDLVGRQLGEVLLADLVG